MHSEHYFTPPKAILLNNSPHIRSQCNKKNSVTNDYHGLTNLLLRVFPEEIIEIL